MTDIKEAARAALSAALRDPSVGFAIKAGMMGGAYEAFMGAVEAAIADERERCAKIAEDWHTDHVPVATIDTAMYRLAERIRAGE